jgi:hypothetical protein
MKHFNLNELVNPPYTDSISGRDFGIGYSDKIKLLELVQNQEEVEFIIDDNVIKAINDSFVKGLFSKVFENLKTIGKVEQNITITSNEHFKRLFFKNWRILENIYNV